MLNKFFLALFACAILVHAESQIQRLREVKKISVYPVQSENSTIANLLTGKLIAYLAKQPRVQVVESPEDADATLLVAGQFTSTYRPNGQLFYHVQGAARLHTSDGVVLWAEDLRNSPFARSATSSFAVRVAKKLMVALLESDKR